MAQIYKIPGYFDKWHIIDSGYYHGEKVYLMENTVYGDEAANIIIKFEKSGMIKVILDDVCNGFDDLKDL